MKQSGLAIAGLAALLALGGCNSASKAVEGVAVPVAGAGVEAPVEEVKEAKVVRQEPTVSQKGTYIRALVNGDPITNYDLQRRSKFRQLRRLSTGQEATLAEMVDERLKLQEARSRGTMASDSQVNEAFANFAKSNRSTPQRIAGDLNRIGVGADHFKEFIRAQISWSRTVGAKLQSETVATSQSEAIFALRKAGAEKPTTTEYTLQQIVFVVPQDKRKSLMKARRDEALAFKQRFSGCEGSIQIAKELRDVSVKDLGRMMQPEVPPSWKDEIIALEPGQTTRPKETDKGIEVLAVCSSRITSDDRAAQVVKQEQDFSSLETKGDKASEDFLAELRRNATIIYR